MFSTTHVDAPCASLWKSRFHTFADKHLVHRDDVLITTIRFFPQRLWMLHEQNCGQVLQLLAAQGGWYGVTRKCAVGVDAPRAMFSTAHVDARGKSLWIGGLSD